MKMTFLASKTSGEIVSNFCFIIFVLFRHKEIKKFNFSVFFHPDKEYQLWCLVSVDRAWHGMQVILNQLL